MDENITDLLIEGLTTKEFLVYYLVGIAGILIRFLVNVSNGIKKDTDTPYKFQFKFFVKGLIRIVISFTIMALVVARFNEFSPMLLDLDVVYSVPTRLHDGVTTQATAGITAGLAFTIGLGIDEVVKRIVGSVKKR